MFQETKTTFNIDLRDVFAGFWISGLAAANGKENTDSRSAKNFAEEAYMIADTMIKERNKK